MGNFAPPLSSLPKAPKSSPPGGVLPEKTVKSQVWSPLYFFHGKNKGRGKGGPGLPPIFRSMNESVFLKNNVMKVFVTSSSWCPGTDSPPVWRPRLGTPDGVLVSL